MTHEHVPFRLSGNLFATFLVIGVVVPFLPVWLKGRGLGAEQIGLIFAAALWAKIPAGLLVTYFADRWGHRKRLLIVVAATTLVGFLAFPYLRGFTAILVGWLVVGALLTTMIPLADCLAVTAIRKLGVDYGRIRLWGSVSFIFASVAGGYFLQGRDSEAVMSLLIGGSAIMALSTIFLPDLKELPRATARPSLFDLTQAPGFVVFVISASILQASHAALYGFATLQWTSAGIGKTTIGLLWAEGVIFEIVLFAYSARLVRRLGVEGLLLVAGVAGMVRWTVLGSTDWVPALVMVQALHALTFAGTLVAAIAYIAERVPKDESATAQGLYDGLAMGFVFGLAMAIAGQGYADMGASVFYLMAGFSGCGAIGALVLKRSLRG